MSKLLASCTISPAVGVHIKNDDLLLSMWVVAQLSTTIVESKVGKVGLNFSMRAAWIICVIFCGVLVFSTNFSALLDVPKFSTTCSKIIVICKLYF